MNVPVVMINSYDACPFDSVHGVRGQGTYLSTHYLISLGHTRIGFAGGARGTAIAASRKNGYLQAMREAGLPVDEQLIFEMDFNSDAGRKSGTYFSALEQLPTAICCANDMGSCTNSNYAELMGLPGSFCPICSFELLEKAVAAAKALGYKYHVGNIASGDQFYGVELPHGKTWEEMGVLAGEMESTALYTNAAAAGVNALCIVTISDGPEEITTAEERQTAFTQMMEVALALA